MFSWINFLTYVSITSITPGANNIISLSNGSHLGFKKSLPCTFGMWLGSSFIMVMCAIFCSVLSSILPQIKTPMLMIGASYMLYLAYKTVTRSEDIDESKWKHGIITGFLVPISNPKMYLYGIVSMEAYILPYYGESPFALLGFAFILSAFTTTSNLCWLGFGSRFKVLFSKYSKITNTILALLLVYCAISLFR